MGVMEGFVLLQFGANCPLYQCKKNHFACGNCADPKLCVSATKYKYPIKLNEISTSETVQ